MKLVVVLVAALVLAGGNVVNEGEKVEPENSISDVMKKAHMGKDGLLKKVGGGDASDDEKKALLSLYIDMLENDPPKGEKEDWVAANQRIVVAAAGVVLDREGAADALREATDCKACHDAHK